MKKLAFVLIAAAMIVGCKKDPVVQGVVCDGSNPTWNSKVSDILSNSCWGSSCHGTGAQAGDYTTYAGIKPVCLSGQFEQRVLIDKTMPQGETFPDSILAKLQCWVDNGFLEN